MNVASFFIYILNTSAQLRVKRGFHCLWAKSYFFFFHMLGRGFLLFSLHSQIQYSQHNKKAAKE